MLLLSKKKKKCSHAAGNLQFFKNVNLPFKKRLSGIEAYIIDKKLSLLY